MPQPQFTHAAIVSRTPAHPRDADQYLLLTPEGRTLWTVNPEEATPFPSMREAMRMTLRLPPALRAVGLPRDVECGLRRDLH